MLLHILQIAECKIDESKKTASEHEAKEETSSRMLEMQAKVSRSLLISKMYRVTKVLGDTDYVDIKMRVASII